MDEPLSNLDAKLRAQTRAEIRALQQRGRHDDGLRHARPGRGDDDGRPDRDHARRRARAVRRPGRRSTSGPANTFVAGFIGSPAMSLARVGAERRNGALELVLGDVRLALATDADVPADVIVGARPEHTRLWDDGAGPDRADRRAASTTSRRSAARRCSASPGRRGAKFVIEAEGHVRAEPGETLRFGLRPGLALPVRPRRRAGARPDL